MAEQFRNMESMPSYPQLIKNLRPGDIESLVSTQLSAAHYLLRPEQRPQTNDKQFEDNENLWSEILRYRLRSSAHIILKDFILFEWFPRSPGLYHTGKGRFAREEALHYIISSPPPASSHTREAIEKAYSIGSNRRSRVADYMYVFSPQGKLSMLQGGVGCIRLKPRTIESGKVYFMSASSTAVAHEGFPVAVPEHLYSRYVDRIAEQGALSCSLAGRLQFVPDPLAGLFNDYTDVPQLYLIVEEIFPSSQSWEELGESLEVSVAVSFQSDFEGEAGMYASYVTFHPEVPGSFDSRVDWLENIYVEGMYRGKIVTNFDEHINQFAEAVFSLDKVMSNRLDAKEISGWAKAINFHGSTTVIVESVNRLHVERVDQMSQEKVINIGAGAIISAPVVIADTIENSFNSVSNANIDESVKALLTKLIKEVAEASKSAPGDVAEIMARDVEALSKEVTSNKPRRKWYEVSVEGLKEAAISVGKVGKPILETVGTLLPLLHQVFP